MLLKRMLDPHSAPFHTGVEISTGRFLADLTKCYVDLISGGRESVGGLPVMNKRPMIPRKVALLQSAPCLLHN